MNDELLYHIATTFVAAGATIGVLKTDITWIKQQIRDHIREDNERWNMIINGRNNNEHFENRQGRQ